MLQGRPREFVKRLLVFSRIKFLFDRITLTPYTILYFFTTLLSCLVLAALQGVILSDNTKAVNILADVVDAAEAPPHITIMVDGRLHVCDHIPDRFDTNCTVILGLNDLDDPEGVRLIGPSPSIIGVDLERRDGESDSEDDGVESDSDDEGGIESESDGEESDDEFEDDLEEGVPAPPSPPPPPSSTPPPAPPPPSPTPPPPPPPPGTPSPPPAPPTSSTAVTSSVASPPTIVVTSTSSSSLPATTSVLISITSNSPPSSSFTFTTSSASTESASSSTSQVVSSSTLAPASSSTSSTVASTETASSSATESSATVTNGIPTHTAASSAPATIAAPTPATTGTAEADSTPTSTLATSGTPVPRPTSGIVLNQSASSPYSMICIYSLSWLEDDLHDAQREDVATFFFQLWLFTIGLVGILNESLPHLGAALIGHILGGAWASSRISSTKSMSTIYRETIVPRACDNVDLLGSWWDLRLAHTIPMVVLNVLSIIALGFLSWKLLRIYATTTFSRMGGSASIHNKYKLVLFFSVCLQLASFFTAASSGLWVSKIVHGNYKMLVRHGALYLTAFAFIFLAVVPWLYLGWMGARRESRIRFFLFAAISVLLIGISSAMFSSGMYRSIFKSWQLFAKVTVTAFVLLVVTFVAGIACFFNYGKGLKEHLHAAESLEGDDFAPVHFAIQSGNAVNSTRDAEKGPATAPPLSDLLRPSNPREDSDADSEKMETGYWEKINVEQPPLTYSPSLSYVSMSPRPAIPVHLASKMHMATMRAGSPNSFSTTTSRPVSSSSFGSAVALDRRPTLPSSPRPGSIKSLERRPTLPSSPRPNSVRSIGSIGSMSSVSERGRVTLPASPRPSVPSWLQPKSRFSSSDESSDRDSGRGSSLRMSYATTQAGSLSGVAVPVQPSPAPSLSLPPLAPELQVDMNTLLPPHVQVLEVPERNRASLIESILGMPSPAFTTSSKRTNLSHGTAGTGAGESVKGRPTRF